MEIVDTTKQIYSYDEMCGDLEELKNRYPDGFTYQSVGVSADGRNIYEVAFGSPVAGKKIIIQAGIHAREYMTSQLVMAQLEFYLGLREDAVYGGKTVKELFDTVSIHLFPMMNPDGISISQYGLDGVSDATLRADIKSWYDRDRANGQTANTFENYLKLWKANARGVDLNRNFDYGFLEYTGAAKPGAQKY
nr:peptidase [Lachnospiraceae bacterium]